jgi:SAM-dependent methyltransferase
MPVPAHLLPFSAHNIELADGTRTIPDDALLLRERAWCTAALRTLDVVARRGERLRIVDLGCLEGGFSIEFARCGHDVVGIDARQVNIDRARAATEDLGLENVEFAVDDVKHLADYGQFDVVFCCGLLYHLDEPHAFVDLIGRVARRALILNTHFARPVDALYDAGTAADGEEGRTDYSLSALTEHEGLAGRWYHEYDADAPRQEVEGRLWAAFSNDRSFWPTKAALLGACRGAGFDLIYEQHDFVDDIARDDFGRVEDRAMFVCLKRSALPGNRPALVARTRRAGGAAWRRAKGLVER